LKKPLPSFLQYSLWACWLLLGILLLTSSLYTYHTAYEQFTTVLLQTVHKLDWRPYFEQAVLPQARYAMLPYLLGILFVFWLLLSPWYFHKSQYWSRFLALFYTTHKQQQAAFWTALSQAEKGFLGLIIGLAAVRMLYYMGHYALQYDEAWTYNHFVSNGFWVAAISPNNNHILYTLLACLSDYLPIDGQYSLRLPVAIGGLVLLLVFYKFARQIGSSYWALLGLAFLAFAPAASLYSLYARGYIFQLLFTVIALAATWHLLTVKRQLYYHWTWWIVAHVLGLYSVPTHAYVVVVTSLFLVWKGRFSITFLKKWLLANATVMGCTTLLYAPYFITNGGQVLWAAASQGPSGEAWWAYQDKVADWLLWGGGRGTPVYGIWLGLLAVLVVLYYNKKHKYTAYTLVQLVLLFLLFPTLLNGLTGAQPPYRVWCFLGPILALWIVLAGQVLAPHWQHPKQLLLGIFMIIGVYSWRLEQHYALQWSAKLDWQVQSIAQHLLDANIQHCYLFSNYDKPLLEYYYLRQGKRLHINMVSPQSKDYAPFEQLPLYEAVLWDAEDRVASPPERAWLTQHYPIVLYKDPRIQVHLPKPVE
jgi:hypothetical protein